MENTFSFNFKKLYLCLSFGLATTYAQASNQNLQMNNGQKITNHIFQVQKNIVTKSQEELRLRLSYLDSLEKNLTAEADAAFVYAQAKKDTQTFVLWLNNQELTLLCMYRSLNQYSKRHFMTANDIHDPNNQMLHKYSTVLRDLECRPYRKVQSYKSNL